jgi:enterochelin esterase-like enzyme
MLLLMVSVLTAQTTCTQTSTTTRETYFSSWLGQEMYYTVVLPPCFDSTRTYPTLYLFHGSNDDDNHWVRLGLPSLLDAGLTSGNLPEMLVVLPFGNVIANRNFFDNVSWSNIFLTELMPDAQAKYPSISTNPQTTAIGGISRGGFWAYQIGLRHPELFGTIGGHSAFFDLYHAEPQDNPLDLILSAPNLETMALWLDRGAQDYAAPGLDIMNDRMQERGLTYTYNIYPTGEHNNDYWREHVAEYLRFYAGSFARNTSPTPTSTSDSSGGFVTNTPMGTALPVSGFVTNTPNAPIATVTNQPTLTVTPIGASVSLFVPAVAFPSLQTTIAKTELEALLRGETNARLIIDTDTQQALLNVGVVLQGIRLVAPNELQDALWADREAFTLVPVSVLTTQLRVLWLDDQPIFSNLASYPFAFASNTSNFNPDLLTRITASGVTALTRTTMTSIDNMGVAEATSGIQSYVLASDFFHTSNEVSIASPCPNFSAPERLGEFCSKEEHFELFNLLDVDIVELSGNHNNDYGYEQYRYTYAWLVNRGIQTVGGGLTIEDARRPLILEHHGNTIAWVACNVPGPYYALANENPNVLGGVRPGATECDWEWLEEILPILNTQYDIVVVTLQQLEVEDYLPLPNQRNDFRRLIDLGADFVAGTAAHKPQTFEFYNGGFIHYGLGNLFFDQPFWGNMRFFMDTMVIYDGRLVSVELFPGIIDDNARPRLMTVEERNNFLFFMLRQQNGF